MIFVLIATWVVVLLPLLCFFIVTVIATVILYYIERQAEREKVRDNILYKSKFSWLVLTTGHFQGRFYDSKNIQFELFGVK